MDKGELSDGTVRFLRFAAVASGILIIIVCVVAGIIGLSIDVGFGRNQIIISSVGVFLILSGILGKRFPGFYRCLAVNILNLAVLVIVLEIVALVIFKLFPPDSLLIHQRKVQEGHLELVEAAATLGVYAPFVVWRSNPQLNSDSITVSEDGYRTVPGSSNEDEALRIFLMGGSAMWGTNVSDSNTIPAFLQRILEEHYDRPVAVRNLAQTGHSSTQEIIELVIQLRSGNVPDAVIFYDGFNDVWGAYESGESGGHHGQRLIAARVEGRPEAFSVPSPAAALLQTTNIGILVSALRGKINDRRISAGNLETYSTMGISADALARDIVRTYLGNAGVVSALGEEYGFQCLFVWQPSVWYGEKRLTEYEEDILGGGYEFFLAGSDPAFRELLVSTYMVYEDTISDLPGFLSYTDAFQDLEETVYNDYSGVHVEPFANEMIAESLSDWITRLIPGQR